MNATSGRLLILTFALSALACKKEVTTTEGVTFEFECQSGECTLYEKEPQGDKKLAYLTQNEGRVLTVCPAHNPGFNCRPVECDDTTPCAALGGQDFSCDKVCQAPTRELTPADKLALCLAGTGEWKRTAKQLQRLTLSRGCSGDCFLPAACRKL